MATLVAPPKPPAAPPPLDGGFGGRDRRGPDDAALWLRRYKTGMWLGLGAVVMVFAAFTSAYVVRQGLSSDWRPISLPPILWLNTAVILASSATIERAKRDRHPCLSWLAATSALGLIFLAGQYIAWQQLRSAGVYLASNPSSSFFYLLTGAHGLHIMGGILALFYVVSKAWLRPLWTRQQAAVEAMALYWHFMDGLWLYLFFLLKVGR